MVWTTNIFTNSEGMMKGPLQNAFNHPMLQLLQPPPLSAPCSTQRKKKNTLPIARPSSPRLALEPYPNRTAPGRCTELQGLRSTARSDGRRVWGQRKSHAERPWRAPATEIMVALHQEEWGKSEGKMHPEGKLLDIARPHQKALY